MDITRETVNDWLDSHSRGREWLADRCNVGLSAVGNWLNKKGEARPIPAEHQITISKLMAEDEAAAQSRPPHNLVLEFTNEQYEPIELAALREKMTVREWSKHVLNEAAEMDAEEFARTFLESRAKGSIRYETHDEWRERNPELKVAEDEKEYGSKSSRSGQG